MRVYGEIPTPFRFIVADGGADRESWLRGWLATEIGRSFEPESPSLVRATLIQMDDDEHVLVIVIDHIVSDGWSIDVLIGDLSAAYRAEVGQGPPLAGSADQYPDWVVEERAATTEEHIADRTKFWASKFPGGPEDVIVNLSGFVGFQDTGDQPSEVVRAALDATQTAALREAARNLGVSVFVLTATVFTWLLQRDTAQQCITLSTSSASRFSPHTASVIGYLARSIWVPTTLDGADDLPTATRAFQRDLFEVVAHADLPPRVLFRRMWGPDFRARMNALPQVDFVCAPLWGESLELPGIEVSASEVEDEAGDGALAVYLTERPSVLEMEIRWSPGALADGYARALLDAYRADLAQAAAQFAGSTPNTVSAHSERTEAASHE
jgi:hypothetical protein